jgi:hypothetical protein
MLTVATYFWYDPAWEHNDKFMYGADDVRLLQAMVKRNLSIPHEFAVITDRPELFSSDDEIRTIDLDKTTHVPGTCYTRLFTFHPEGATIFGDRMLVIDIDSVIVSDLAPLVFREENLVLWKNPTWRDDGKFAGRSYYNTSMVYHRCGTMPRLFTEFNAGTTSRRWQDDQWFLTHCFGHGAPVWTGEDGVYRLARADTPGSGVEGELPDNARIVFFPGDQGKPWLPEVLERCPWIPQYRRHAA